MHIIYLTLTILLLINDMIFADVINSLKVIGNKRVTSETILSFIDVNDGDSIDNEKLNKITKILYETGYFADIETSIQNNILEVKVIENPVINQVFFDSKNFNLDKNEALKNELLTKSRGIFSKANLKRDTNVIVPSLQKNGYKNATVEAKIVSLPDNRVDIVFEVNEGELSRVDSIQINGNDKIPEEKIKLVMSTKERKNWFSKGSPYEYDIFQADKEKIFNFYHDLGYYDFAITSSSTDFHKDTNHFTISINLYEGDVYEIVSTKVGNTIIKDNDVVDQLNHKINIQNGSIYKLSDINANVIAMQEILNKNGLYHLNISYKITKIADKKLSLEFLVSKNKIQYVKNIRIIGNTKTQDHVILRDVMFAEGDVLSDYLIQRSKDRLYATGYFTNVVAQKENITDKSVDIVFEVKENKSLAQVGFSGGYSSFHGPIVSLNYSHRNLMGKGYDAGFGVDRSAIQTGGSISFYNPRINNSNVGGGVSVSTSSFGGKSYNGITFPYKMLNNSLTLHGGYILTDRWRLNLSQTYRAMDISVVTNSANFSPFFMQYTGNMTYNISGYNFSYENRDNVILPSRGSFFSIGQNFAIAGGSRRYVQNNISAGKYIPMFDTHTLALNFNGGIIRGYGGSDVTIYDRYQVGYWNMRGFRFFGVGPRVGTTDSAGNITYDGMSYGGNTYFVSSFDYFIPLPGVEDGAAKLVFFTDVGTAFGYDGLSQSGSSSMYDTKRLRVASGVGLAFLSPVGLIRLDFAKPVSKMPYDNVQVFRISIGNMPVF
jgi:outer membrane protein insertion porin family